MSRTNEEKTIDPVASLPAELKSRIFGFLTPAELSRASQVSHSWYEIADDNSVWKAFLNCSKKEVGQEPKKTGSAKKLFITHPEYRELKYLLSDKHGRDLYDLYQSQAQQHFNSIRQDTGNHWSAWEQKKYCDDFEILHKGHPWNKQVLDVVCGVSYFVSDDFTIAKNAPNDYVKAFNYLYEKNVLNKTTIAYIAACVNEKNLSKQFNIVDYALFVTLFYRVGMLNTKNVIAIKTSFNPNSLCAEALDILLSAFKNETNVQQKQQRFIIYCDRLLALASTCELSSNLRTYAKCIVNLYAHGIFLSFPTHAVVYDELLSFDPVSAYRYSKSCVMLHKANLLIRPGCKLLRDLILKNPRKQRTWRAEEIILNYMCGTLRPYVVQELEKLNIDPDTVKEALQELEKFSIDLKTVKKAMEELNKLGIELNTVRAKLKKLNQLEASDTDSGIGVAEDNTSPASSFLSETDIVENTPSPTAIQTQLYNEPLTQDEAEFKRLSFKLVSPDNTTRILHALHAQDAQSFETIQGFLLNNYILRDFFLKRNCGAAAIAYLNGNKRLALFIRLAAELDKRLYENNRSLIKRLPDDDRTQAADTYLHAVYRLKISSAIGNYLQKTSPNKDDEEKLSKALEKATERFCHNKAPLKEGGQPVKSLAEDRTRRSQVRREIAMVLVNVALVLSIVGIPLIIYHHRKYGCTFFGATQSKQTLYQMNKKVLHNITEFSSKQSKAARAA